MTADMDPDWTMRRKEHSGFWKGFGSVLAITPAPRGGWIVMHNGQDLSQMTASEAMTRDWTNVLSDIQRSEIQHPIYERSTSRSRRICGD